MRTTTATSEPSSSGARGGEGEEEEGEEEGERRAEVRRTPGPNRSKGLSTAPAFVSIGEEGIVPVFASTGEGEGGA